MNENEEMKYTPAELLDLARQFRANAQALDIPDAAPGSMIGLWLATADALAEVWEQGRRAGSSRAMRHMSDEPGLSLEIENPYATEEVSA